MSGKYPLPNSSVPMLREDGFISKSWYLFFSSLGQDTGGGGTGITSLAIGNGLAASQNGQPTSVLSGAGELDLNLDYYNTIEGALLTRGPEGWVGLSPANEGEVLICGGPEAEPFWGTVTVPSATLVLTEGTTTVGSVTEIMLAGGAILSAGGAGVAEISFPSPLEVIQGTTTLTGVTSLTFQGSATLSGAAGAAVVSVAGSAGGSGELYAPGWGTFHSTGVWARPALAGLTYQGSSNTHTVVEYTGGPIELSNQSGGWATYGLAPGSSPWTATFLLTIDGRSDLEDVMGVIVANTTSGNFIPFGIYPQGNGSFPNVIVDHWSGLSSGGGFGSRVESRSMLFPQATMTFRIQYDGTNLFFFLASDPLDTNSFVSYYIETLASFLGTANYVGFGSFSTGVYSSSPVRAYGFTLTQP